MPRPIKVVGIGSGGHAKAVLEVIERTARYEVVGLIDATPGKRGTRVMGHPVLGTDRELERLHRGGIRRAFMGVGAVSAAGTDLRARLFRQVVDLGFELVTLIHPQAIVSPTAAMGPGCVVMGGAVIGVDVRLGDNVAVYPGAVIEHDSIIGGHGLVSLGVMIAGGVEVGEGAFLGVGATVIQGVKIGAWATIGAGTVVLDDIPGGSVAVGVPGRVVGCDKREPARQRESTRGGGP